MIKNGRGPEIKREQMPHYFRAMTWEDVKEIWIDSESDEESTGRKLCKLKRRLERDMKEESEGCDKTKKH